MLLISLMLAAAPAPAVKPDVAARREAARPPKAARATRSKRLIELEAAIRSLSSSVPEKDSASGPQGL